MVEAGKQFRCVNGHLHLPSLRAALQPEIANLPGPTGTWDIPCALWFTIFTHDGGDDGMKRWMKGATEVAGSTRDSRVAVNVRVRVYPGTDAEVRGTVVEDYGEMVGHAVNLGDRVVAARRWAVVLDAGGLVFVDSDQLIGE